MCVFQVVRTVEVGTRCAPTITIQRSIPATDTIKILGVNEYQPSDQRKVDIFERDNVETCRLEEFLID
jgi:hypothetical protein